MNVEQWKQRERNASKKCKTHSDRRNWWRGQARIGSSDFYKKLYTERAEKEAKRARYWRNQMETARKAWQDQELAQKKGSAK
jgi:hypothetical protein